MKVGNGTLTAGSYFSSFYTFSKAIDSQDNDNSGSGVAPVQSRGLEKGRAGFDRNHRVIGPELRAAIRTGEEVVIPAAGGTGCSAAWRFPGSRRSNPAIR